MHLNSYLRSLGNRTALGFFLALGAFSCKGNQDNYFPSCSRSNDCGTLEECIGNRCSFVEDTPDDKEEEETTPPDLCCGRVVYNQFADSPIHQFDFASFRDSLFANVPVSSFRGSLDGSRIVFTDTSSTCCNRELTLATITDTRGEVVNTVRYVPENGREVAFNIYSSGDCQLLSDNRSLVAILGEDDITKGGYAYPSAQIYRMDLDGRLSPLTSPAQGIEHVIAMIVAPGDVIYFSGKTGDIPDREPRLWKSSLNNWNPVEVPLAEPVVYEEMNWLASEGKLLVRRSREVYLIDPATGSLERLDFGTESYNYFRRVLIVSPDETMILHRNGTYFYIHDRNSGENWRLSNDDYPCEQSRCFDGVQGVWLPE